MEEKRKLSGKEKFAYGIGAVGKDMVYMLSASYVLYYYQDIMGVKAIVMGIILLIARVFDAFNDPIMGVLVAKTKTKWGKFRPWLFVGTLTNAVILYLMFSAPPSLSAGGMTAYAAIFYILWGVTYTMMDIPYWSMVPAFTEGGKERENLSAMARSCAGVGSAIITIITVMAVSALGNMSLSRGTDTIEKQISSDTVAMNVYVVQRDEAGEPTDQVLPLEETTVVSLDLFATDTTMEKSIYFTEENTNFTMELLGETLTGDNSSYMFAMDSIEDQEASFAIYVDEAQYQEISQSIAQGTSVTINGELHSTIEAERLGFRSFALIIAVVFFIFILITCTFIKEKSTVDVQSASVKDMFKALVQNDQAMAMVITIVLVNTATYITSNLVIYFFKYDLAGTNWQGDYTIFNTFGGAVQILSMMVLFPILRKFFHTMKIFDICIISAIAGYVILLLMALLKDTSVYMLLIPCFFIMAAVGILNVLVTIFLANTVDYGELKNGRRDESVIFSMQTFVVKLASGVSAMIASAVLSIFKISADDSQIEGSVVEYVNGYVANLKEMTGEVISNFSIIGLRLSMALLPVIVLFIAVIVFHKKYHLTDEELNKISCQLKEKRN